MAKGIPGRPPPVPISKILVFCLKKINFEILSECIM